MMRFSTLLVGVFLLGACGGGGNDASEAESPPATEAPAEPTTTTTEPERVVTAGPSSLDPVEESTISVVLHKKK